MFCAVIPSNNSHTLPTITTALLQAAIDGITQLQNRPEQARTRITSDLQYTIETNRCMIPVRSALITSQSYRHARHDCQNIRPSKITIIQDLDSYHS